MNDLQMLEAVERYIRGEMKPDERVYFEQLRKSNPEIDQLVVEHTLFLHQMHELSEQNAFKNTLNEVHHELENTGAIHPEKLTGKAKLVYIWKRYKRVAAIAASIAGVTTLAISALVWSLSSKAPDEKLKLLDRKLRQQELKTNQLSYEINKVKNKVEVPPVNYKTGGTSFMIDSRGYLVTNHHVVAGAKLIAVENSDKKEFKAVSVYEDPARDIAILKIDDENFKPASSIPYAISKSNADLAEPIFTLGFPKNDIVYGQGYLSSLTGFQGDTLSYQIEVAANSGNSGSPILNQNGEVIGVLNGRQTNAEGFTFAIHSKYIFSAVEDLKKQDSTHAKIRIPLYSSIRNTDRKKQVEKISNFIYIVKVNR